VNIRAATANDANHLAILINLAGENLPEHLWRRMAGKNQDPLDVGALRAAREEGSFSYRHAMIAEVEDQVAGMVLSYHLPDPYDTGELHLCPAVVRPLIELEARAPGSWYVNAIATYEPFRGRGVATAFMSRCEDLARKAGVKQMSLIVAGANEGAHALYLKLGYQKIASRPLVVYPDGPEGGEWWLMVKNL